MSKDRKRNRKNLKPKRVILLAYEGENKTERYYFENFKGADKNYVIKIVPGNETDPVNLVKQTIQKAKELELDLKGEDRAFCVFDTDVDPQKNLQILSAVALANSKKITVITSSPCIETWFLIHFEYTTSVMTSEDVIRKLKHHYPSYKKNCNIYPILEDKISIACNRAKQLETYQKSNGRNLETVEANPHSDIYQIIEELEKTL